MTLAQRFASVNTVKGEIAIAWLGQAGFLIKDSAGHTICIDPYLSDYCERLFGFKRIMPKIISPDEICADLLISSHDHADHFDADSFPFFFSSIYPAFIGAVSSVQHAKQLGFDTKDSYMLSEGDVVDLGWCRVTAVYADHGELAPDAVGLVVETEGILIYYVGDTAYRPEKMQRVIDMHPDIILPPINGEYGNLDSAQAVKLAKDVGAKLAIACHYWMFAMHRGDPQSFLDEAKENLTDCEYKLMYQGEIIKYKKQESE